MSALIKILLLVSATLLYSLANADVNLNYDKTYTHDNTFCSVDGKRIEIEVKSLYQYTAPDEAEYGEELFILANGQKSDLKYNQDNIGRYRLFRGENEYCTKAQAIRLSQSELAIFMLRDNRPFNDQLLYVVYDFRKNAVVRTSETSFLSERGILKDNKFYFQSVPEVTELQSGIVIINGQKHNFIEKTFTPWIVFNGTKFTIDMQKSFEEFEWKNLFKNQKSFTEFSTINQFQVNHSITYKVAVNHQTKKSCISFDSDVWMCN